MTTDFRALCVELTDELADFQLAVIEAGVGWACPDTEALTDRARAALAEADGPAVPEGREPASVAGEPSDDELQALADQFWVEETAPFEEEHYAFARAVLARWGFKQCMELDASWLEAKLQKARDEELEACCEWMVNHFHGTKDWAAKLRADRRPKPPSLSEPALQALVHLDKGAESQMDTTEAVYTIRRALERLQELEGND